MIKYNNKENCNPCPCPPQPPVPPVPPYTPAYPEVIGVLSACGEPGPRGFSGAQLLMKDVFVDDKNGKHLYKNVVYLDTNQG